MSGIFNGDAPYGELGSVSQTPVIIFDTVACISSASLGLIVLTARLSPHIRRSHAWYTMFIVLGVFPLLYLVNWRFQFSTEDPSFGLCMWQASLIYAGDTFSCSYTVLYSLKFSSGPPGYVRLLCDNQGGTDAPYTVPRLQFSATCWMSVLLLQLYDHLLCYLGCARNPSSPCPWKQAPTVGSNRKFAAFFCNPPH